jgi:thioredoxin reductase (NADPH)
MNKPVILVVDDDPDVLRAIERDLRSRYRDRCRILRADSGPSAVDLLRRLKDRGEQVALFVVDYRMPQMNGIELLLESVQLYPEAKRTLLTAYADTEAAIKAINEVKLNHYLLKPWDPPERHLYPVLDDLLEEWFSNFRPPYEGLRILGTRWAADSYDIRTFLARNQIPFQWLDADAADRDPEVRAAMNEAGAEDLRLPVAFLQDGSVVHQPSSQQLAELMGLRTRAELQFYDVAIVGGGPAGLAAAVYGASEGLRTVMVEREAPGGQAGLSSRIENYLGFPSGLTGGDLTRRAVAQAKRFGVEIVSPQEVTKMRVDGPYRYLQLSDNTELSCHALLIATGVQWRKLDIPGADRLQGSGIYYGGGTTEAISCRDEDVYIIGGANSAGQAAMFFSRYASRVVMLVRGESLKSTMSQYLIEQIEATPNIEVRTRSRVTEAHGDEHLEAITIASDETGRTECARTSALFIFIGAEPRTNWLDGLVERDARGFILTGPDLLVDGKRPKNWPLDRDPGLLETSIPGTFAVGDVRHGSVKRVASGVGEGSIAIQFVHQYLAKVS